MIHSYTVKDSGKILCPQTFDPIALLKLEVKITAPLDADGNPIFDDENLHREILEGLYKNSLMPKGKPYAKTT